MKSPQLENGYIRIANEIWSELCWFRMAGQAVLVLNFIIKKTYGFNKKEDKISNSQIVSGTRLSKGRASFYLSELIKHKIVTKDGNKLCLNKNYDDWISFNKLPKMVTKKLLPKMVTPVTKDGNDLLPLVGDTIDNKDTIKTGEREYNPIWGKEVCVKYSLKEKDLKELWERMVSSRLANGKPYKDWKRGCIAWLIPSIQEGKIKKIVSLEDQLAEKAEELGLSINNYKRVE